MLSSEASRRNATIELIRKHQDIVRRAASRDAILSTNSVAEQGANERRNAALSGTDLGKVWDGIQQLPPAERERANAELRDSVQEIVQRYLGGNASGWLVANNGTTFTGMAHAEQGTPDALRHLDRDSQAGIATVRAMNAANRRHWNR